MFNVNNWFLVSYIVQHSHILLNFQAPNVGPIMDNTPQMIRDGYSIQHFISKFLFFTSLASQFCHLYTPQNLVSSFSYQFEMTMMDI